MITSFRRAALTGLTAVFCLQASPSLAGDFLPADLQPITYADATLTIIQPDGTTVDYSPEELEKLPTYQLTTTTPWDDGQVVFEGVMLADLLAANGLPLTEPLRVIAENDYISRFEPPALASDEIMVATRANGQAISRRERGPFQFVAAADVVSEGGVIQPHHLVWMARVIEAAKD